MKREEGLREILTFISKISCRHEFRKKLDGAHSVSTQVCYGAKYETTNSTTNQNNRE